MIEFLSESSTPGLLLIFIIEESHKQSKPNLPVSTMGREEQAGVGPCVFKPSEVWMHLRPGEASGVSVSGVSVRATNP
jgi:hypothetical protein